MARYPANIANDVDLLTAANRAEAKLTSALSAGGLSMDVSTTTEFASEGVVTIDNERIKYTEKTSEQFLGLTRSFDGSEADLHSVEADVYGNYIAAHHNLVRDESCAI